MRLSLQKVNAGVKTTGWRMVLYGPGGVGKSSLAACMPAPLFFDPRGGTDRLDVNRFPVPEGGYVWEDVFDAIELLKKGGHEYKTLVLDELGRLEELSADFVRRKHGANIFIDYGKGWVKLREEWIRLVLALEELRSSTGMNVCLIGHSITAKMRNPEGDDFDRYSLKIDEKVQGQLFEWADAWLFCRHETLVGDRGGKKVGVDTGARLIHALRTAAYDAKNRFGIPPTVAMSWDVVVGYIENPPTVAALKAEAEEMISVLREEHKPLATTYLTKAGNDTRKLTQLIEWMKTKQ